MDHYRRKRAKDKLYYLRRKVVDLEETLSSLNQVGRPKAFCASNEDKDVFFRWKQVAERQIEEANKAVIYNLKLRAMLECQLTIVKRLEAVMGEYKLQVASDAFTWHPNQTRRGIERDDANEATRPIPSDDVIFSDLNGSLEEQYRQVDSLLETSGIAHVKSEMVGKHYLKQDVQGISFLVEEVRVFPLMFQSVDRTTWSCMLSPSYDLYGQFRMRILEKNHLNVTILDTVQLPKSQPTRVLHCLALRRHFEANRVVLLWSGWLQIDDLCLFVFVSKARVSSRHLIFTNGKASSARPQGTIVRNIVDVKPELVELGSTDDWIGEMTDLVLGMYHRNMGMYNQVVENLLL
ncbi:hypothetical protein PsorP6_010257 [Peronosclerospora sorghi]|uniref:Uncharacterized protein n=1 Tax=Peronosclerospora sorghi TaxID=230839 RepID=A0ACC0VTN1_9STRA|nr:hypothetical protein PsorP6_010257 [Peronosclerospora sorghi]